MLGQHSETIEPRLHGQRRHARRVLYGFLAGSVVAHAVVLGSLPQLARDQQPVPQSVLEVTVLKYEAVPDASPPPGKPKLERPANRVPPRSASHEQAPVLALSDPRKIDGAAFTFEPSGNQEPTVAAPSQEPLDSNVARQPAGFSAAYLSNPAPSYPAASRRAGEQGTVTLRVRVAVDGSASRVTVEKSSGSPHLDAAALEAVKAWRFTPARRGADAVESWMLVPIVFRLEGRS
jgi:protein TonB